MGMESFFVTLALRDVRREDVLARLREAYPIEPNAHRARMFPLPRKCAIEDGFVVRDAIIMRFDGEGTVSLEACFSNYEAYVRMMFDVYTHLKGAFPVRIDAYGTAWDEDVSYQAFRESIVAHNAEKFEHFQRYRIGNVDLLPGEPFYRYVRRSKR